jgi:hypothetical protein
MGQPLGDNGSYQEALKNILNRFVEISQTEDFESCQHTHRWGNFAVLNFGIGHGQGSTAPFRFSNTKHSHLEYELTDPNGSLSEEVGRVAGFQSSSFASWFP